MEKLDLIITDFTKVEYGIESLVNTLDILEELYDIENDKDLKSLLNVSIRNLESLRIDLRKSIIELDNYMIEMKSV